MRERVLITGASGFVGYHLIEEALQNNLEVFIAVRKSSKIDHLKELDIQYIYPEFNNKETLKKQLAEIKPDYIIHAAGVTSARSRPNITGSMLHIPITWLRRLMKLALI